MVVVLVEGFLLLSLRSNYFQYNLMAPFQFGCHGTHLLREPRFRRSYGVFWYETERGDAEKGTEIMGIGNKHKFEANSLD